MSKDRVELGVGYAFMRAPDETAKNLNGFNASLFYNVKPWVGVGADFTGEFGSTSTNVPPNTSFDTNLHRYLYLFGPQFSIRPNDKVKIFVHSLFGGVHDTTKTTFGTTSASFSANAFAMAFGGGVDVRVGPRISIRPVELDYVPTHFGGMWQHNFRYSAGVVFKFGRE